MSGFRNDEGMLPRQRGEWVKMSAMAGNGLRLR